MIATTRIRLFALAVFFCCGTLASAFAPKTSSSLSVRSPIPSPPSGQLQVVAGLDIIEPSYNLAVGAFGVGLLGGVLEDIKGRDGAKLATAKIFGVAALLFTLFAGFLAVQTTTLRFTFDDTSFSLVRSSDGSSFDNVKVGGENKWAYSSFQNWDFLPSQDLPILVYFKENQTPEENRAEAPIVVDTMPGQAHFFPAIANSKQLEEGFRAHTCAKVE
jgi:hypothetical protein